MVNYIVPNTGDPGALVSEIEQEEISREKISSFLLFFDRIAFLQGYHQTGAGRTGGAVFGREQKMNVIIPDDEALIPEHGENEENAILLRIDAAGPNFSVSEVITSKVSEGFNTFPGEEWICHPKFLFSDVAARHLLKPSIKYSFLDGLYVPGNDVDIRDVLDFKKENEDKLHEFWNAMFDAANQTEVDPEARTLFVPDQRLRSAIDELNATSVKRWINAVKKSFSFQIRPDQKVLERLAIAIFWNQQTGNVVGPALVALSGAIRTEFQLVPQVEKPSEFAKAIAFARDIEERF